MTSFRPSLLLLYSFFLGVGPLLKNDQPWFQRTYIFFIMENLPFWDCAKMSKKPKLQNWLMDINRKRLKTIVLENFVFVLWLIKFFKFILVHEQYNKKDRTRFWEEGKPLYVHLELLLKNIIFFLTGTHLNGDNFK